MSWSYAGPDVEFSGQFHEIHKISPVVQPSLLVFSYAFF